MMSMEWFWFQENEKNELTLLRMFGDSPVVRVPDHIAGKKVVAAGAYCFSEKCVYTGKEAEVKCVGDGTEEELSHALETKRVCSISGAYPVEIILPDGMEEIGDLAFYQCRSLEKISVGEKLSKIGSDAFMNCGKLQEFIFRSSPKRATALRQILAQRPGETTAYFEEGETTGAIVFPEYTEAYDVIGPAHIFSLNIEGEGFRARQCFENGVFQFEKYDRIFGQACDTEEMPVLCRMAALRILYPVRLNEERKREYLAYLISHQEPFYDFLIENDSLELVGELYHKGVLERKDIELCIQRTVKKHSPEGTRKLLAWKKEREAEGDEEEYGFEAFS